MDRYQRVEKPRPDVPISENEIRITTQGMPRNYITYAMTLLREKGASDIILKAMGRAISKTVTIAEIIKRRIPGLHQNTEISSADINYMWEPLEEGLLPLETTRHVSMITIMLSRIQLDTTSAGYQPPLPADQVKARRTLERFYSQVNRGRQSQYSQKQGGASASQQNNQTRDDAWNRYNQRVHEEYEEEMERVERIRRMQSVFNRERSKYKRSYEKWYENDSDAYQQQNFQREDWYWKTDKSYREKTANERKARMRTSENYTLAHHYEALGLDMSREEPYSEAEIKSAFRIKAKEYHPDQNLTNKEAAEAKFKEVMVSYEALKKEKKT